MPLHKYHMTLHNNHMTLLVWFPVLIKLKSLLQRRNQSMKMTSLKGHNVSHFGAQTGNFM